MSNAIAPSNFILTNPELFRETVASNGENLVRGMKMLAEDIAAGKGDLKLRQADYSPFEIGKNVATTPGKVVGRSDVARTRTSVVLPAPEGPITAARSPAPSSSDTPRSARWPFGWTSVAPSRRTPPSVGGCTT